MRFTSIRCYCRSAVELWRSPDAPRTTTPPTPAPMQPPAAPPTPGDTFGLTSANRLVTFNRAAPSVRTAVAISGLQAGEQLLGIDIRPGGTPAGELYALGSTGRIYTINTTQRRRDTEGACSPPTPPTRRIRSPRSTALISAWTSIRWSIGCAWSATPDRTCASTSTPAPRSLTTRSTAPARRAPAYPPLRTRTASRARAARRCSSSIPLPIACSRPADPNAGTLSEIGSLGVNADAGSGYEIVTAADGTNSAIAVLTVGGATTLYTINLDVRRCDGNRCRSPD